MFKLYCRIYQRILQLFMYLLPWHEPKLLTGKHSLQLLPPLIKDITNQTILLVTDKTIASLPFFLSFKQNLLNQHIKFVVYDEVIPNPTIDNIENARALYLQQQCGAIVAIGGGSVIDCAKGIGARIAKPNKTISQLKGQLKIRKKIPYLFAVPTTAGTGSEATVAAVISNSHTLEKYAVNDLALIPYMAVLDETLTVDLPPHITATTGMDALTHAVEAFIGHSTTKETRTLCLEAVELIFSNLETAYTDGQNLNARANMLLASYKAGRAFTRSYVGNIHAVAHTLGGYYQIPHGLANAIIMPHMLRFYGNTIYKKLAKLADAAKVSASYMNTQQKAEAFIVAIEIMNARMNIPQVISGIKHEDIPFLATRALQEANPLYPVPVILNKTQIMTIYRCLQENE